MEKKFTHERNYAILPPEILQYVSLEQLETNALAYPEMQLELTENQTQQIIKIKSVLDEVPLLHISSHEELTSSSNDIIPKENLPEAHHGHSYQSDRSLGLTKCTFFGWGIAQKGYGKIVLQVSTSLLNDPRTFATPTDIGHIEFADNIDYSDFSDNKRKHIEEEYFKKMVSGQMWKEIIARRIMLQIESGKKLFPLDSLYSLGEIKHFGVVSKNKIIGSFPISDMRQHYRFLYEHGFSFSNMEQDNELSKRIGKKVGVDPSYEECGINYEEAKQFWKNKLEIK